MGQRKNYFPDEKSGICVVKRKDESVEDLIKRFKKKFGKSGITKEVKEKMYFEKPSDKKRRKRSQSIRNIQQEKLKEEQAIKNRKKTKKKKREEN